MMMFMREYKVFSMAMDRAMWGPMTQVLESKKGWGQGKRAFSRQKGGWKLWKVSANTDTGP